MSSVDFSSFGDEFIKIAFIKKLSNAFMNVLREGWHGTKESPNKWLGEGRSLSPSYAGRAWQEASSLGGMTRVLPVGAKSMMLIGTGAMIPSTLTKTDPTGQQRSRTERVVGLAGNTIGGLAGSVIGSRLSPRFGGIVGGIGGGILAEKALTKPFANSRQQAQSPTMAEGVNK